MHRCWEGPPVERDLGGAAGGVGCRGRFPQPGRGQQCSTHTRALRTARVIVRWEGLTGDGDARVAARWWGVDIAQRGLVWPWAVKDGLISQRLSKERIFPAPGLPFCIFLGERNAR